jgi:hypothetical protein
MINAKITRPILITASHRSRIQDITNRSCLVTRGTLASRSGAGPPRGPLSGQWRAYDRLDGKAVRPREYAGCRRRALVIMPPDGHTCRLAIALRRRWSIVGAVATIVVCSWGC